MTLYIYNACIIMSLCDHYVLAVAPALQECPRLRGPVLVNDSYVFFYCEITQDVALGELYRLRFLFNNEPSEDVPIRIIGPFETEANKSISFALHEKYLRGHLNKWVRLCLLTQCGSWSYLYTLLQKLILLHSACICCGVACRCLVT